MTPRTILFREEHSPRVLVRAGGQYLRPRRLAARRVPARHGAGAGDGAMRVPLPPGARALLAGKPASGRDAWRACAPPPASTSTAGEDIAADAGSRRRPELALLRGPVCDEMLETYPEFCARVFERKHRRMTDAFPRPKARAWRAPPARWPGCKVIDLTRVLGGPYCTMMLSDHGAEVIKLEPPQGDEMRDWGPPFDETATPATSSASTATSARSGSICRSRRAGEVLLRLLEGADVLVENFKPGSMEKWGLGYEEVLSKRFPRLIHCRVSGFGADGPLGGFPGYDAVLQAMVGLMSINGTTTAARRGSAIRSSIIATGLFAAIAILMALQERERSGRGQFCDMTLHDCGMALLHPHAANYFLNGKRPKRDRQPASEPGALFQIPRPGPARSSSPPATTRPSAKFCDFLGMPELAKDARFATNGARVVNRDALTRNAGDALRRGGRARADADRMLRRRPAGRAGAACGRGDGGRAYRAPRDGDGARRLSAASARRSSCPARRAARARRRRASTSTARRCWRGTASRRRRSRRSGETACWWRRGGGRPAALGAAAQICCGRSGTPSGSGTQRYLCSVHTATCGAGKAGSAKAPGLHPDPVREQVQFPEHRGAALRAECQIALKVSPAVAPNGSPPVSARRHGQRPARRSWLGLRGRAEPGSRMRRWAGGSQALFLKRQLSLPVSTMSQWWVSRSSMAVVIFASPTMS